MTNDNIAAFGIPNPVPSPSVLQASASTPLRILLLPDKVIKKFISMNLGYYHDKVPAGSYSGMEKEGFDTIAYTIFTTVNAKVADDLVYNVTKATYDEANRNFMVNAYKAWQIGLDAAKKKDFIAQMKSFGLQLHPGAARYWKERGLME